MGDLTPAPLPERRGFSVPEPLTADHDIRDFSCGKQPLDDWLRYRASKADGRSARTYVVCLDGKVVGYYSLSAGAVRIDEMPKKLQRNMPGVVPVILIGRLAVHSGFKGLGIGRGLLKDALLRASTTSRIIGARAVMVHALDNEAAAFYAMRGFQAFPEGEHTFFMAMETIEKAITQA
jgi:GNAT superfamily N-acetyltransferase